MVMAGFLTPGSERREGWTARHRRSSGDGGLAAGDLRGASPAPPQRRRDRAVAMPAADTGSEPGGGRAGGQRRCRHEADDHRAGPRAPRCLPRLGDDLDGRLLTARAARAEEQARNVRVEPKVPERGRPLKRLCGKDDEAYRREGDRMPSDSASIQPDSNGRLDGLASVAERLRGFARRLPRATPRVAASVTLLGVVASGALALAPQRSAPAPQPARALAANGETATFAPVKIVGAAPRSDNCAEQVWPYIEQRCLTRAADR